MFIETHWSIRLLLLWASACARLQECGTRHHICHHHIKVTVVIWKKGCVCVCMCVCVCVCLGATLMSLCIQWRLHLSYETETIRCWTTLDFTIISKSSCYMIYKKGSSYLVAPKFFVKWPFRINNVYLSSTSSLSRKI